jgi:glycosyltransferase involved in cell wall biosynthesis
MIAISIVVPAHNEARRIGRCIEALQRELEEAGVRGEIIVVDNASTDDTRDAALLHKGITVVDERFKGRVQARRAGVVVASGELIACVEADAVVGRGWLNVVLEEFEADPTLAAISGPLYYPRLDTVDRALVVLGQALGYGLHLLFAAARGSGVLFESGNCVMRREALRQAGGFELRGDFWGGDAHLLKKLIGAGRVVWVPALRAAASARGLRSEGVVVAGARYALEHGRSLFSGQ